MKSTGYDVVQVGRVAPILLGSFISITCLPGAISCIYKELSRIKVLVLSVESIGKRPGEESTCRGKRRIEPNADGLDQHLAMKLTRRPERSGISHEGLQSIHNYSML